MPTEEHVKLGFMESILISPAKGYLENFDDFD